MPYCQMKTASAPLQVAGTEDVRITLADGRSLIDGIASWWTACHGYNHPHIVDSITRQLRVMPHVMMGGLVHQQAMTLCERLAQLISEDERRVFLCDSGSVSVEVAMKMAIQFWRNRGIKNRQRFICFSNSYHGDTSGAMSVCDPDDSMHAHFKGFLLQQFPQAIPRTEDEIKVFEQFSIANRDQTAGVIIEPLVQMAGGMRFHSPEILRRIWEICRQHDLLLIADEVATGLGRTGTLFAFQQSEIIPDIVCVGKALTGGCLGLAATIASPDVYSAFHSDQRSHALMHGPTFMGNAAACAAANASLDLFATQPRLRQVSAIETLLRDRLEPLNDFDHVVDVRCLGAIGVVQLDDLIDVDSAIRFFVDRGVWIRPLRDVIYLAPSFTIGQQDLHSLCDSIQAYVRSLVSSSSANVA